MIDSPTLNYILMTFVDYFRTTDEYAKLVFLEQKASWFNCDLSNTLLVNYGLYSLSGYVNLRKLDSLYPLSGLSSFSELSATIDVGFLNYFTETKKIKIFNIVNNRLELYYKVVIRNNYRIYIDLYKYEDKFIYEDNKDYMFDMFEEYNINKLNLVPYNSLFDIYGYCISSISLDALEIDKLNNRLNFIRNKCIITEDKAYLNINTLLLDLYTLDEYFKKLELFNLLNLFLPINEFTLLFIIVLQRKSRILKEELNKFATLIFPYLSMLLIKYNNLNIVINIDIGFYTHKIEFNLSYNSWFNIIK